MEIGGTEIGVAENLGEEIKMDVKGVSDKGEGGGGGWGGLSLLYIGFNTQESELGGTTLVDAYNGFNKLGRLAML